MYQKRKISIMILVIFILQIAFPILNVIVESALTSKSIAAEWKTATVDGITWQYYLDEGTITKLLPKNDEEIINVIIPSSIDGYTVTGIVQFWKFKNLESIEIPNSVTNIESKTFMDCNKLKNVVIGSGVTEIKEETFKDCVSLENITINGNIKNIENEAFSGCSNLKSIEIPDSTTTIGISAFQGCSSLKNVKLGNGVKEIKIYAFKDCKSIQSIIIPNSVTDLGSSVFEGCTSLVSANIGTGETMIGVALFDGCSSLTTINVPDNIEIIGNCAFRGCSSLKSINIPNSVKTIGICAFEGCSDLVNINVDESNEYFEDYEGVLFGKGKTKLICFPAGKTIETYDIPSTVGNIEYEAFYGCSNLKTIHIPNSVTSISNCVFQGCSNLQNINFPDSIDAFGAQLFLKCNKLTSIDIDENSDRFANDSGVLFSKRKDILYIYPPGKTEENYSVPNEVKTITNYAFYDCDNLKSVVLSNNITDIGIGAFSKCDSLENMEIPNSVQNIGHRAFEYCKNLTHVTLPNSLEKIENGLFWLCTNLRTVNIPENVNSIEYDAFYKCSNLDNVILPDGITTIGQSAFRECSNMTNIQLPKNLKVIDYHSFYRCEKLDNVILPEGLTSIGYEAFYGCIGISEITLPSSIEKIGYGAFDNSAKVVYYPAEIETAVKKGTHYFRNFVKIDEEPIQLSKELTGLFITTPPTKTSYIVGENFDKTGIVVIACYNDGSKKEVTDYIVTDGSNLTVGKTNVTVSYTEGNVTIRILQNITVSEKLLIEIHDLKQVEKDGTTYIESINPGATVKSLTEKIDTNGKVEIFKGTEKVTNVNTKLATGMTLKISLNNEQIEYTIVVTGDLNGDGKMGDIDVLRIARYRAGLDKNLTGAYLQASNIFKDDNYADNRDLLKMVRILVGLDSLTK